jgi:hypothetical protein
MSTQVSASFIPFKTAATGGAGVSICFSGDFPKKVDIYGQVKFDLPITLLVTMKDVRRKNEINDKSSRQPGSQRAYHFNPKDYSWERLIRGPAYYVIWPTPTGARACSLVELDDKGAKAGFDQYFTTTGKLRLRVASSGQFLGDSLWAWEIESFGTIVIWQGTDSFINICINHSYEIRSRGGRLYCVQKGDSFYTRPTRLR